MKEGEMGKGRFLLCTLSSLWKPRGGEGGRELKEETQEMNS